MISRRPVVAWLPYLWIALLVVASEPAVAADFVVKGTHRDEFVAKLVELTGNPGIRLESNRLVMDPPIPPATDNPFGTALREVLAGSTATTIYAGHDLLLKPGSASPWGAWAGSGNTHRIDLHDFKGLPVDAPGKCRFTQRGMMMHEIWEAFVSGSSFSTDHGKAIDKENEMYETNGGGTRGKPDPSCSPDPGVKTLDFPWSVEEGETTITGKVTLTIQLVSMNGRIKTRVISQSSNLDKGACVDLIGECTGNVRQKDCEGAGGTFLGPDSLCVGACCGAGPIPPGCVDDTTPTTCTASFQGWGTTCPLPGQHPCVSVSSAPISSEAELVCRVEDEAPAEVPDRLSSNPPRMLGAGGIACGTPVPTPDGACCTGSSCEVVSDVECLEDLAGSYQGDASDCSACASPCPTCTSSSYTGSLAFFMDGLQILPTSGAVTATGVAAIAGPLAGVAIDGGQISFQGSVLTPSPGATAGWATLKNGPGWFASGSGPGTLSVSVTDPVLLSPVGHVALTPGSKQYGGRMRIPGVVAIPRSIPTSFGSWNATVRHRLNAIGTSHSTQALAFTSSPFTLSHVPTPFSINDGLRSWGERWTTGRVVVSGPAWATSASGFDTRTPSGLGGLQLVTPRVVNSLIGGPSVGYGVLTLTFVPEPTVPLALGVGIAGLLFLGWRRRRPV